MANEASHDSQRHTPHRDSSRRKPSTEGDLQAEMEHLRASVAKMSENYEHLRTKNVELEHDCRALRRSLEDTRHPFTRLDHTQDIGHTQLGQPTISRHSVPIQSRPDKGKDHLHPETTRSRLLHISPPKDRPHAPTKIYKDCRDRISEKRRKPIPIPVDLEDQRVAHLGPLPKPTRVPDPEGTGDSDDWEPYHPEAWESYHPEDFEKWEEYPPNPTPYHGPSTPCTFGLIPLHPVLRHIARRHASFMPSATLCPFGPHAFGTPCPSTLPCDMQALHLQLPVARHITLRHASFMHSATLCPFGPHAFDTPCLSTLPGDMQALCLQLALSAPRNLTHHIPTCKLYAFGNHLHIRHIRHPRA